MDPLGILRVLTTLQFEVLQDTPARYRFPSVRLSCSTYISDRRDWLRLGEQCVDFMKHLRDLEPLATDDPEFLLAFNAAER
jgi:hypothetical protein